MAIGIGSTWNEAYEAHLDYRRMLYTLSEDGLRHEIKRHNEIIELGYKLIYGTTQIDKCGIWTPKGKPQSILK